MHTVICPYCKLSFDADKIPYIKVNSTRYAHVDCAEADKAKKLKEQQERLERAKQKQNKKTKEQIDKENLEKYILNLFNISKINTKIRHQINKYLEDGYDYIGILRALSYFYDIKGNDISKANGGIGIVPYVYQEAHNYFYTIWLAKQKLADISIKNYTPEVKEIHIDLPKRKPRRPKVFTFLDEDDI